ncbi:MAG: HAMP domain-containing histidine kinase [Spirochaetaceae bacterium]|jgi:signal transduction histidine kinase|nr:HAMP domain-containing histidine kinase [Spirochaetaceae bacterium]
MISLKNRLALTLTLFICAAFAALFFSLNTASKKIFDNFVRGVIAEKNQEIARAIAEQYRPLQKQFDIEALESVGMIFMHDGFIVDVEDERGSGVWNARDMDMEHCAAILQKISERMNSRHGKKIEVQSASFPLLYAGMAVGNVNIASAGPLFYTEAQSEFITHLNITLAALFFISLVVCIVFALIHAEMLSRPIVRATLTARKIAANYAGGNSVNGADAPENADGCGLTPSLSLPFENYKTRELAALSFSINEMSRELQEAQARQKQLTGDVAHELRTPLASIQGTIEAFLDGVWDASPERLVSLLNEVKRLTQLVNDLQVLSSFESGAITLNKTEFDIAELLQSAAEQFTNTACEKGIEIKLFLFSWRAIADYGRTKQVVINLLSNAVKYTAKGSVSVLMEKITRSSGEVLSIKIADTGSGIPQKDLPHIFERFYRAEKSRNRGTGGAGVGLTIARAICDACGWEIRVESEEGRGSVFTLVM